MEITIKLSVYEYNIIHGLLTDMTDEQKQVLAHPYPVDRVRKEVSELVTKLEIAATSAAAAGFLRDE